MTPSSHSVHQNPKALETRHLPVEVELFIEPDGTVVFADLAVDAFPIARQLAGKRGIMFEALIQIVRDWSVILSLRWQVAYLNLRNQDRLADDLHEPRKIIQHLEHSIRRLTKQTEERDAQIAKLEQEKRALENRRPQGVASARNAQFAVFRRLHPIVTQWPTLRMTIQDEDTIPIDTILELLAPLDEVVDEMGFEPLETPGEKVAFNPDHHRAVGKGARSINPGDTVKVRYIGYTYDGEVVYKAHVTHIDNE